MLPCSTCSVRYLTEMADGDRNGGGDGGEDGGWRRRRCLVAFDDLYLGTLSQVVLRYKLTLV